MGKEINYTWDEIYKEWEFMAYRFSNLNEKLVVHHIQVEKLKRPDEEFYGLDWIQNEYFDSRTELIKKNPDTFLFLGDALNKGTLTTLTYLTETDDQETRAAIWIYAFLRDIVKEYGNCWSGDTKRVAKAIEDTVLLYLRDKNIGWYHSMRKLMPEICFSQQFLKSIQTEDKGVILELVALAVNYIYMNYKVAWYDSRNHEVGNDAE
ncbi:MAG: hypothetical protein KHZ77_00345 [Veillonella sp.]|uniref:hypothetical protein n=1 Tax=Veillonella sp. TaxID=1926307 RepID=UPI0025D48522|nr:hypothetical protein [Veillonella sp.]MBS4912601.1 hypothetical protein [Veillonella sp.]